MATTDNTANGPEAAHGRPAVDFETIVIGAGFGGVRMMYECQKRGMTAKLFEAGSNVGGTWYWNRYPGARTDTESWVYILTFLEEIDMGWKWKERFPTQPEVEQYVNHVVDHLDLRKDMEFNTRVTAAHRDEANNIWKVTTSKGTTYTCTFLISATGPLATPLKPPFPGLNSFRGEWYQTGLWPQHKVDFAGKRVAVVGTGATAVQVIPIVAHTAKTLTVFQRTPNFVLPARNHPLTDDQLAELRRDCHDIFQRARTSAFGMDIPDSRRRFADIKSDAEAQRVLDFGWEIGGFRFIFQTFADMLTNQKCNDLAAEFVRNKIRSIVEDHDTAELLSPHYPVLSKRPPLGHYYYEAFNRDNVKLVDIKKNPIKDITPTGLRTGTTEYEFDVIIFALGFDAITGTLAQIDLRGSQGQDLGQQLRESLATAYGITVENFPNLFMITGPLSPFANIPPVIDNTADWIGRTIMYMRDHGYARIDTKRETAEAWREKVNAVFNATVLPQGARDTHSWYVGANVEGKPVEPLFWLGGVGPYFQECENEITNGFPGFSFSTSTSTSTSSRLENGQTATATTTTASDGARESRI
ncbi:hypothetical protein LTR99_005849 [Exophiala xenobiotica]|uniref:Cyclohexanone monooxygenase n=1 Tax=Vermiconidia calcicola TaxID=1690605 RepID=A0AAV9QD30_9PEZI|nr:hypothetical protein LTR92_006261 [Exophiala xenobiotica]KAK5541077.1 hypothetical protein LTR25_002854 [Vermiconidia calcicola]KAK5549430.1 hypothetical protein LTR23_000538 [Chaetothyriales sp. CCFEE 6169]KAK5270467.1 hypothetical protein LTR96_004968 [Exophiala xenobiotica]KAK5302892.1 hypothetical protein LTR99_005849 [Exophiala xenobiotica]